MRYLPLLLLLITFPAPAETVHEGQVVKIADGDTLTLLVDSEQLKIRLSDIALGVAAGEMKMKQLSKALCIAIAQII